jgi:hypothetical protein
VGRYYVDSREPRGTTLANMGMTGLVLTAVGTIATVMGAYFAWVAIRRPRRRHARPPTPVPEGDAGSAIGDGTQYDLV